MRHIKINMWIILSMARWVTGRRLGTAPGPAGDCLWDKGRPAERPDVKALNGASR
jgi:hypothetical protein